MVRSFQTALVAMFFVLVSACSNGDSNESAQPKPGTSQSGGSGSGNGSPESHETFPTPVEDSPEAPGMTPLTWKAWCTVYQESSEAPKYHYRLRLLDDQKAIFKFYHFVSEETRGDLALRGEGNWQVPNEGHLRITFDHKTETFQYRLDMAASSPELVMNSASGKVTRMKYCP